MWDLPRTGWLLRGVRPCESLAEHSFGVAFVAMLLIDAVRANEEPVDGERVLRMALIHDVAEAKTGDIPMPQKTETLAAALHAQEHALIHDLLPPTARTHWEEMEACESLEARIVAAADKIQMMVKALMYETQKRGQLREFWENPKNFRHRGLDVAQEVFDELRALYGAMHSSENL